MRYCKNCKWCIYREFASLGVNWGWFCRLNDVVTTDGVGHSRIDFSSGDCSKLNKDKNCQQYIRKWWKLWVRGEPE